MIRVGSLANVSLQHYLTLQHNHQHCRPPTTQTWKTLQHPTLWSFCEDIAQVEDGVPSVVSGQGMEKETRRQIAHKTETMPHANGRIKSVHLLRSRSATAGEKSEVWAWGKNLYFEKHISDGLYG